MGRWGISFRFLSFCTAFLSASIACAIEVVSQRSDTFIFEKEPSGEYSKSDFVAVGHIKGERAITYLTFEIDAAAIGISPKDDFIMTAQLTLFLKAIPLAPDSNANASKKDAPGPEDNRDIADKALESAVATAEQAEEKLEESAKHIISVEVWGIIDDETFEPNSQSFRVSWDGKTDGAAPKHNTIDDKLDFGTMTKLGIIELDLKKYQYDDGDRIEFTSDEFIDWLNFVYGITAAHSQRPKFRSPLAKIQNATIVLRQESGPSGLFFYAADSIGEKVDKVETGEEIKKDKDSAEDSDEKQPALPLAMMKSGETESEKKDEIDTPEVPNAGLPPTPNAAIVNPGKVVETGTVVSPGQVVSPGKVVSPNEGLPSASGSGSSPALDGLKQANFWEYISKSSGFVDTSKNLSETDETKKSDGEETDEEKKKENEKPDFRPRITFEYHREVAPETQSEDSSAK